MSIHPVREYDSEDSLDGLTLTTTRLSWSTKCIAGSKEVNTSGVSGMSDTLMGAGGLTTTHSSTLHDSTITMSSPTTESVHSQPRGFGSQEGYRKRARCDSAISPEQIWEDEGEVAHVKDVQRTEIRQGFSTWTPSTVRAAAPQSGGASEPLSPDEVRRRLSLHTLGRLSGVLPPTVMATPISGQVPGVNATPSFASVAVVPASGRPSTIVTPTPTPLRRYGDPSSQMMLMARTDDPPTESRPLLTQPGCSIPSPRTPLWTAPEEEMGADAMPNGNHEDNDDHRHDDLCEDDDDDVIVRLPLARRPSNFSRVAPLSQLSVSLSTAPGTQRDADEAVQPPSADKWVGQMRQFFARIDERPLLVLVTD
ncbi:unnamed protein product [Trypanosoma congolense IL3000]|uniref:WGS project CAEQ00000000 data, annotated contig 1667 n=1 Tax=Trypanosoma congolense (strain IL3000) TaxID=1068625 RepID=F9W7X1_TRYCI|nr:unnamed protein product [Trypanosoma congolense IL3000]